MRGTNVVINSSLHHSWIIDEVVTSNKVLTLADLFQEIGAKVPNGNSRVLGFFEHLR